MLGYAYIFLMLAICLALIALIVIAAVTGHFSALFIKIAIVLVVLAGTILRSMWVKMEAPKGIALTPGRAPALFQMLDAVSAKLAAPRFHHVLLVDDFNAAVLQVPRLGIFGWQVNYLLLGLPLMQSLSPEEFESVVAHEMGHLSGNHSRFAGWIYRVRQTWVQLLTSLVRQRHKGAELFTSFFKWYAPYFSAYSFVLARADEYEADRCAAQVAGARTAATALLRIPVQGRLLSSVYWPAVYRQAAMQPEPPPGVFANLVQTVQQPVDPSTVRRWVAGALHEKTETGDTHPSLTDRLASLGFTAGTAAGGLELLSDEIRPVSTTAADALLGPAQPELTMLLDHLWRQSVMTKWRQRFVNAQQAQQNLNALNQKAAMQPLTVDEQLNRARWTAELIGNQAGIPLLRDFVAQHPGNAGGNFLLGECLLEENDESGIPALQRAMEINPEATIRACSLIYKFLHDQGRFAEADWYLNHARGRHKIEEAADEERSTLTPRDAYLPHGLDAAVVQNVASKMPAEKDVAEAYLVRKSVKVLSERPLFVLGIVVKAPWYKPESEDAHRQIAQRLAKAVDMPGQFYVLTMEKQFKPALRRMQAIDGALIYRRGR